MPVYTLHLYPPLGPADAPKGSTATHYTGTAKQGRLRARWTEHALGRGAKMLAAQVERGGKWVPAKIEPGGHARERQLKIQGGASRRCGVCKAESALKAGKISLSEALTASGWNTANEYERSTLLEIFGAEKAPPELPVKPAPPEPRVMTPAPQAVPMEAPSEELTALADQLISGWRSDLGMDPEADNPSAGTEPAQAESEAEAG